MTDTCQLCHDRDATCVVGIDDQLRARDPAERLTISKHCVKLACGDCAGDLVEAGNGREMPIGVGVATDIWYSDRVEITDNESSLVTDWPMTTDGFA